MSAQESNGLAHRARTPSTSLDGGADPAHDLEMHPITHPEESAAPEHRSRRETLRQSMAVDRDTAREWWDRFRGKNRVKIGWGRSFINIAKSSWLNALLILIPFAWASHFMSRGEEPRWPTTLTFVLCFLAIIPLEKLFDFGGEQMAMYTGKELGDLIMVTLNNAVEATLAIILLLKCDLQILQSTIVGVVLLHLLLIPGTAFLTGGARIWEQHLDHHITQLNHTLLTIGVLTLLLPAGFFAALDRGAATTSEGAEAETSLINDTIRGRFLQMSRGLSLILLCTYIASRIFLHNPPGEDNALKPREDAHPELKKEELHLAHATPEVSPWAGILLLVITVAVMAVTAEFLVESIEFVREDGGIGEIWFGLILLPIVSFAADGAIAIGFFVQSSLQLFLGRPEPPAHLAKGRAIENSIQFTLFWMPFVVLLGWWTGRPMSLLFDFFLVAMLLGATFLVNYVTADAKTNWVEGFVMVAFYAMIALCAWFYPGQEEVIELITCGSISSEVAAGSGGEGAFVL